MAFALVGGIIASPTALGKNAKPKEGLVAIGLGAGPHTITDPEKSMDTDTHGTFFGTVNLKMLGPFHVALGIEGNAETGRVNYRYLGVTRGHASTIHALDEKRIKYIEAVSYAAVIFRP